jgi:hypothetical protein
LLDAAGCEDCEHPRGLVSLYPERVGHAARQVRERPWAERAVGVAADDPYSAFEDLEDLEDLVFGVVDVERWPELRGHPELGGAYASVLGSAHRELHAHACAHLQDVIAFARLADDRCCM